jgi:hypothetical protein
VAKGRARPSWCTFGVTALAVPEASNRCHIVPSQGGRILWCVRTMFAVYVLVLLAGIVSFVLVGLTHG